jgi:hypothetical protein
MMRMILEKLNESELGFLRDLLNAAGASTNPVIVHPNGTRSVDSTLMSAKEAIKLDSMGEKFRRAYERKRVKEWMRNKNAWFATPATKRRLGALAGMQAQWSAARLPLIQAVVNLRDKPGNFVHLPFIVGLPAHYPAVLINDATDLVGWMIARGMANHQLGRLVLCQLCRKFGLRDRAKRDAHFCSLEHQKQANIQQRKERSVAVPEFGRISENPA